MNEELSYFLPCSLTQRFQAFFFSKQWAQEIQSIYYNGLLIVETKLLPDWQNIGGSLAHPPGHGRHLLCLFLRCQMSAVSLPSSSCIHICFCHLGFPLTGLSPMQGPAFLGFFLFLLSFLFFPVSLWIKRDPSFLLSHNLATIFSYWACAQSLTSTPRAHPSLYSEKCTLLSLIGIFVFYFSFFLFNFFGRRSLGLFVCL